MPPDYQAHRLPEEPQYRLDRLQQVALSLMGALTILTFVGTNLQALLWQSSDWLVGTVLPAVVVDLTNNERDEVALSPLVRSAALDEAARQKAVHMARYEYFSHFGPDGTSPWYFFDQAGYVYAHAGENLAIHFTDSAEVVEAWMNSPAHKENIVHRSYTEIGVGTARGSFDGYDTVFVVQLFGTPAAPPEPTPLARADVAVRSDPPATVASTSVAALQAEVLSLQDRVNALRDTAAEDSMVAGPPVPVAVSAIDGTTQSASEPTPALEPDPVAVSVLSEPELEPEPGLVIESQLSTSSGLAIARMTEPPQVSTAHAGGTLTMVATRPSLVLDIVYAVLVAGVLVLLCVALLRETRQLQYAQAVYSLVLLAGVGGLWFVHTLLTSGAVIV